MWMVPSAPPSGASFRIFPSERASTTLLRLSKRVASRAMAHKHVPTLERNHVRMSETDSLFVPRGRACVGAGRCDKMLRKYRAPWPFCDLHGRPWNLGSGYAESPTALGPWSGVPRARRAHVDSCGRCAADVSAAP